MKTAKNLEGQSFGRLTVVSRTEDKNRQIVWKCLCTCGNVKSIAGNSLVKGLTKSCGCYQRELMAEVGGRTRTHGMTGSRTYRVWSSMKSRCTDTKAKSYKDYGGRGIKVCPSWFQFTNFLLDMGEAPAGLSIERVDNSRGYSKENCIWATQREQLNNKRDNVVLVWRGETMTASQWAVRLGFTPFQVLLRLSRGWSTDRALSTPIRKHSR